MVKTINGKTINIPDNTIKEWMISLNISMDEAIEMWLDDNDIIVNEERAALDKKAKTVKIQHNAQTETKKERKHREKKENFTKKSIIEALHKGILANIHDIDKISIRNDEKYIDFTFNGVEYTINLVAHRAKK